MFDLKTSPLFKGIMTEDIKKRLQLLEEKLLALQDELTQLEYAVEIVCEVLELKILHHERARRFNCEGGVDIIGH